MKTFTWWKHRTDKMLGSPLSRCSSHMCVKCPCFQNSLLQLHHQKLALWYAVNPGISKLANPVQLHSLLGLVRCGEGQFVSIKLFVKFLGVNIFKCWRVYIWRCFTSFVVILKRKIPKAAYRGSPSGLWHTLYIKCLASASVTDF